MANSAEFRRVDQNITDLRNAVSRMGFNIVRSVAVAFAMRQLRRKDTYPAAMQSRLEQVWEQSLEASSICFVLAKRFTRLNPDQALLTGLLHVLGHLYIIMRSKDAAELTDAEVSNVIDSWHATIGKAILESWELPQTLQHAVEHQDEFEADREGDITLTDVLIAAKLLIRGEQDGTRFPALRRLGITPGAIDSHAEELRSLRRTLSE
jgi:HD-like signal output (HDOD) protein